MSNVKLKTVSNGSVTLTPQDTAADVVLTVPSTQGSQLAVAFIFSATVTGSGGSSSWTGSNPSTAVITVPGILATDVPIVDINLTGVSFANIPTVQSDWGLVYQVAATGNNQITLYATAVPVSSFNLTIQVTR